MMVKSSHYQVFSSAFTIIYPPFLSFFTSVFFNFWCLLPPPSQRHPAAIAGLPQQSASVVRLPPAVGDDVQEAIQTPEAHHDVPQHAADDGHQDVPVLTLQVVHVKPGKTSAKWSLYEMKMIEIEKCIA